MASKPKNLVNGLFPDQIEQYRKELVFVKKELDELKLHRSKLSIIGEMTNSLSFDIKSNLQDLVLSLEILKKLNKENPNSEIFTEHVRIEKIILKLMKKLNETCQFINKKPIIFHKISLKEIIEIIKKDVDIPSEITLAQNSNCPIICDPQLMILAFTVIITKLIQKLNGQGNIFINVRELTGISEISLEIRGKEFSDKEMIQLFDPFRDQHLCCSTLSLESAKEIIENHGGMIHVKNNPTRIVIKFPNSFQK